jgi:hypothetical protein
MLMYSKSSRSCPCPWVVVLPNFSSSRNQRLRSFANNGTSTSLPNSTFSLLPLISSSIFFSVAERAQTHVHFNPSPVMASTINAAKSFAADQFARGQNAVDAVFPPEKRSDTKVKLQSFAQENPKLAVRASCVHSIPDPVRADTRRPSSSAM